MKLAALGFTIAVLGAAVYFESVPAVSVVGGVCFMLFAVILTLSQIIDALTRLVEQLKNLVALLDRSK
jgi:hypothetical protein